MKFFFPDSQDLVDPSFNFELETRREDRNRQRDDLYAHEVFEMPPYDGILVSKSVVEGHGGSGGRYPLAQRHRFDREGVKSFMRLPDHVEAMGDCGAFSYVRESEPPVTVEEVAGFYQDHGFDCGASVDHIILQYKQEWDHPLPGIDPVPDECRERQQITLDYAEQFMAFHKGQRLGFEPIGVAQGWSPKSYADIVKNLQKLGYRYIALGGLVPLKSREILDVLESVSSVKRPQTRLHLFGVTRLNHVKRFSEFGVVSFDSTSPLRQAFKEDKDNYYGSDRNYVAIRVPQVDVNPQLKRRIVAGEVDQTEALRLERECLEGLQLFDRRRMKRGELVALLGEYQRLFNAKRDYTDDYDVLLKDRPWKDCSCDVCQAVGINVVIFRGAERNRRRGFHNVYVTFERLKELRSAEAVA